MAPTQQSSSIVENSEKATKTTTESTNMVHERESHSTASSSSSSTSSSSTTNNHYNNDINNRLFGTTPEMVLPITSRGHFFHDAFFQDARQHFQGAVKNVLDDWGHRSSVQDDLATYRMIRKSDLSENSQAATVTENSICHKVVIDVLDFKAGDVKVKVVDDDQVVVEGSVEQQNGGSVSKKSFRRSFNFPGLVKAADISSTMSSDGVLTITVPKKQENVAQLTNINIEKSNTKANKSAETTKTSAESAHQTSKLHSQEASSVASSVTTRKNSLPKDSKTSNETNSKMETTCNTSVSGNGFSIQPSDLLLPISHSGPFFQDSFFAQAHQQFEEAMKEVLHTVGESPKADVMTSYRSLRERNLTEENQAVSVTEDNHQHKVVIDVHDFKAGDVKVKVVDEDQVVVEGSVEQQNGGSMSKKSFRRSFNFPGLVKAADISSTMSSDGVLTITVPKKEIIAKLTNINIEKSNTKANKSAETTKTSAESAHQTSKLHSQEASSVASSETTRKNSLPKDSKTSNETNSKMETTCNTSVSGNGFPIQPSDLLLPISHNGPFFQDSFFAQAHQQFEEAMKEVLHTVGESPKADVMTSYRSLRERNLTEENQAVSVTEDNHQHKVVIDVQDFKAGDVKVKVVDEDQVVVEGSVEQQNGGSVSKKSFRRSFNFPGLVKAADISSTMSSDGVLTVTVPKKEQSDEIKIISSNSKTRNTVNTSKADSCSSINSCSKLLKESSSKRSVHTEAAVDTEKQVSSSTSGSDEWEVGSNYSLQSKQMTNGHQDTTRESSWVLDSLLPVFPKGPFFHDCYFKESRQQFDAAVKEALSRLGHEESQTDDFTLYRNLRANDMTDYSQAVKITENEQSHQVVLDVHDFLRGDIKVKVVGTSEVQVEGRLEEEKQGCVSTRSFRRSFHLPGVVDVQAVTSALSSDGVLTIKAPKGATVASKSSF